MGGAQRRAENVWVTGRWRAPVVGIATLAMLVIAGVAFLPGAHTATGVRASGVAFAGLLAGATIATAARARRTAASERAAWSAAAVSTGLLCVSAALWSLATLVDGPGARWIAADLVSLASYPAAAVVLVLFARAVEPERSRAGSALDALATAALVAGVAVMLVAGRVHDVGTLLTTSFTVGDVAHLALLVGLGLRLGRAMPAAMVAFAGAIACTLAADAAMIAVPYVIAGPLDVVWGAAAVFLLAAPTLPSTRTARGPRPSPTRSSLAGLVVPAAVGLAGLALLALRPTGMAPAAVALVAASLLVVAVRVVVLLLDALTALDTAQAEGHTDALTGLGNRRALRADLDAMLAADDGSFVLALFDLDGFKAFNDTHGHGAGDDLLRRVARRLSAAAGTDGRAYRLGGDELCLVLHRQDAALARVHAVAHALREGGAAPISASVGAATLPTEASGADDALALADARMYAAKGRRHQEQRPSPLRAPALARPRAAVR